MRSRDVLSLVLLAAAGACGPATESVAVPKPWPPVVGQRLPDLTALDHTGAPVSLASLRGKVLLIEPIGMSCPGCVAFAGGEEHGAFEGVQPQSGVGSIDTLLARFGDTDIGHEDLVVVQMLFFSLSMQTPTVAEAARWHRHFGLAAKPNHLVLVGPESIRQATYASVPGFWLVDRDLVLRHDSTGHHPAENLYETLLPAVPELLAEAAPAAAPR